MRSFASDNNSGVHPLVMDAVIKANDNHAVGYGDDPWTAAATAKIKEVFGEMASPFFVFNGTGDRKSTRLNSSHRHTSRMPSSA